jgi:hypothetical protein
LITSRNKVSRIGFAALLLAGVGMPALGQDTPESLLPPGFDDPAPTPAPGPAPAPSATRTAEPALTLQLPADNVLGNVATVEPTDAVAVDLSRYELPQFAKHSLDRVGVFAAGNAGFPADSFGASNGRFLQVLMRRMDAPVASRWASIVLRRALMSPLDTPAGVNGADFAADRAWTLLRMGEANAARAVIEDVDADNYTGWLYQVAMQTALANGDPAALCPIADKGAVVAAQRGWALAQAMCMGLAGKPNEAGQLFNRARSGTSPSDIDNLLAEKVLGTGAQGRRAVTIEWNPVSQLTAWRWGLATATGVEVPASLYQTVGPQVRYWQALAPNVDPAARAAAAELAATAGVFSTAGLVDLYSEIEQGGDTGAGQTVARDLRTAYTDGNVGTRIKALRTLWDAASTPRTQYARLILTARAASWIPASDKVEESDRLIASMLSSGYESAALEWRGVVARGSEGWALLALADPGGAGIAAGDVTGFADSGSRRKAQMLLAGLAGLGRLSAGEAQSAATTLDVQIGGVNAWTQAIDAAGQRGDAATVALLAGVGMQSPTWDYVAPEALFHIVAAMRAAGMVNYARMIAVEAVTRSA